MTSVDIQTLIDKSKAAQEEEKQLLQDLTTEIRLLRLALQELPSFKFDQYGHLLVSEIDD